MKLLTVTGGPTWPGNMTLPALNTDVGRVTFTPVGRVVDGVGGTIGEYTAKIVVGASNTLVLQNMDGGVFKIFGGLPLGVSAGDVENVRAPRYKVREEIEVNGREIPQEFIIEPYESAANSASWAYNTLPVDVERVGGLPLSLAQAQATAAALAGLQSSVQTGLADIAQTTAGLQAAAAGAVPYANLAAFPAANLYNGKAAWATDTGFVYKSNGSTWVKTGEVATTAAVQAASTAAASALSQVALLAGDQIPAASVASIPNVVGTYRVTQGVDAGQVHQRLGNGTLVRLNGLEGVNFGTLETRAGVNVLDYRQTADGADIAPAVLRAAQKIGAGVVRLAPGQTYTWATNITLPAAVVVIATGAVINVDASNLYPRRNLILWDAAASGGVIERVSLIGGTWRGNGYIGGLARLSSSSTSTPGTVRDVRIEVEYAEGFNEPVFRVGVDGDATDNFVVEGVHYLNTTTRNCGLLNRITATGANGANTLTLTSRDQFGLAAKLGLGVGLRFLLGGGPEIYTITGFNAAGGTVTISPALSRTVTDAWVFTNEVAETSLPNATGTAGQTTVTLASADAQVLPGMRLAFVNCRGQYVVQSVAGTLVTLTTALKDTFSGQPRNGSGPTGTALYLGAETRQATVIGNVCEGMSGNFLGKQADKRSYLSTQRDGDYICIANRIGFVRMAFESAGLGGTAVVTGTVPTVTGALAGTLLTVTNNAAQPTLVSRGWTVNSLVAVAAVPGLYRIVSIDEAAGTFTVTRYDLQGNVDVAGGLLDAQPNAASLYLVRDATGKPGQALGGSRAIFMGNIVRELTRNAGGYAISWGAGEIIVANNVFSLTERSPLELFAERISGGGNTYLIRKWKAGMIAPQIALSTVNISYLCGPGGSGGLTGEQVLFDGFTSADVVQPFTFYARRTSPVESTGFTLAASKISGFTAFASYDGTSETRADNFRLKNVDFDAPLCTGQWAVTGRGWRVDGGVWKVGAGFGVFKAPTGVVSNVVGAGLDFAVKRLELQGRASAIDASLTAGVRTVNNEYLLNGVWSYDIPAGTPLLPGYLTKAAAVLGLDPKVVFVDNWRTKADSATLTAPIVGSGYAKVIGSGTGDWGIASGQATLTGSLPFIFAEPQIAGAAIARADADVSLTVSGTGEVFLRFRQSANGAEYWRFGANNFQSGATSSEYLLYKQVGGVSTKVWGSAIANDAKIGDELRVIYVGSLIKLYVNDVLRATITDTDLQANTRILFSGYNNGSRTPALKDFIVRTP
ncbi:hypothetical protein ACFFLM_04370 [Deinococcus oregonensis]|uniref:Uncharacterized protein n=1 Tax=Deinococcus oregonensis TaxID=1805970 RepID=A0ABV6AUN2_9DEIO